MKKLPFQNNIKMNILEITPNSVDEFSVKRLDSLPIMKTGTTTVACKVKDGVVMATDNRATMGIFVANKNARKLHQIQEYMYMTIAGGVADALYLIELLKAETEIYNLRNEKPIGVNQTAKMLQNILYNKKGWYQVGLLLGGYTEAEGSRVFDLGGYGSLLDEDYCSVGSGSVFALGILETEWHDKLSVEDGMNLCVKAVRSAIIRDIASGNGIDVVGIQKGKEPIEKSYKITDKSLIELKLKKSTSKKKK
jgi:proteasome beta subunit